MKRPSGKELTVAAMTAGTLKITFMRALRSSNMNTVATKLPKKLRDGNRG